ICQNALSTLGVVDYQLRSDIYELFLPDKEPEVDLIMIHGLCGSVAYTWRQKDHSSNIVSDCWPKVRADRFKYQLEAAGVGRRPIIFICHSMGGLLAKRLLLDLPALAEKTLNEDFSKISDQIPVIVSMAETKASDLIGRAKGIIVPTQSAVFERGAVYHIDEMKFCERRDPATLIVMTSGRDIAKLRPRRINSARERKEASAASAVVAAIAVVAGIAERVSPTGRCLYRRNHETRHSTPGSPWRSEKDLRTGVRRQSSSSERLPDISDQGRLTYRKHSPDWCTTTVEQF
ncbi:hypothetical protein TELCIR_08979, partial [Teladorsagia circumcincta]